MGIYKNLKAIRIYRGFSQDDFGEMINVSGASYGRKEKGKEGGLGLVELEHILSICQINPLFLFGYIKKIELADLKSPFMKDLYHKMSRIEINEDQMSNITVSPKQINRITDCIHKHPSLLDLLKRICDLDDSEIQRTADRAIGYIDGVQESDSPGNMRSRTG